MIFKTITDDVTGATTQISIFNSTLSTMKRNLASGQGITYSIFNGNKLTQKDVQAIISYSNALKNGASVGQAWSANMTNCSVAAKQYVVDAKKAGKSTDEIVSGLSKIPKATNLASVGLKGLAMAGNMLVMWGISEAISAIATAIDNEVNRVEYAQERLEEFNSTVKESKEELEGQKKWIEENGNRYEELARGVDNYGHNVSLTADEFSEYQSITKDIADMFPNMIKGYNDQNDVIIKMKGNVDALTESYKDNVKAQYTETLSNSAETYDDYKTSIEDAKKQKAEIEFLINSQNRRMWLGDNYGFTIGDGTYSHDFRNVLDEDLYEQLTNYLKENQSDFLAWDGNGNPVLDFSFDKLSSDLQQKIRSVLTTANSTITTETSKVKPVLEAFIYGEDGSSSGYGQLDEAGKQAIRNVISSLDDTFYSQFDSDIEMASYFQTYFIEPLKDGLDDTDLAVKINTLFSIDKNNYSSYKEYVEDILNKINQLKSYTDKDGNPIYSNEQLEGLKRIFGVSDISSTGEVSGTNLVNQTKEKYKNLKGADKYIDTLQEDEIRVLYKLEPDKAKSLDALKQAVSDIGKEADKEANKTDISYNFDDFWKSIGNTEKATELKEELFKLASTGELTGSKLKSLAKSNELLKSAMDSSGLSAGKLAEKIRELNIDNIESDINLFSDALDKVKNKQSLTAEETASLIAKDNSLAGSVKKTKDGYLLEKDALVSVINTSKEKYNVVVSNEILETSKVIQNTEKRIKSYEKEIAALRAVMTARQNEYNSLTNNGTEKDSYGLDPDETARALLGSGIASTQLSKAEENYRKSKKKLKGQEKKLKELQKSLKKLSSSSSGSKGSKGSKGDSSKSKELINWIERKLERLNTKLDLVKAKYDNLPLSKKSSISLLEAENKNLDEQIKLLKKIQSVNDKSYSKYMKKADNSATYKIGKGKKKKTYKLSKSLIKKIQNGKIDGTLKKLIATYGEPKANAIQKYQDYYDKAESSRKNSQDAKKSIADAKVEKLTNAQNYYDTLNAMNQAYESTAKGLSKNNYVQEQIEATKQSYNYQIKIAKAQGDYNKAKQLEQEKEKATLDLQRQKVENIKAYYDNQVGILNNDEKEIQNKIDLLEAQGNIVSKSYYSSMSGFEKQKIADRQAELNKLNGELAKVAPGSDDWYELQNDIQSVEDSINESQKAIVENTKAIGELIDTMYAEINAIAENLGSEFDFIGGLARGETSDSDTGRLTDTGLLQLYTSGLSYSTYKATLAQSNQRLKEIQDANKQGKLLEGYASLKSQKEAENEIAKTAQEQANSVKSYGDKIIEIVKDAISSMTDHLQDLIDARKEALDEEKDLRDYERSILEKTKNVSSLQKQYMAATGDTSEEGRLRMAQLRKSLDEAQQDLQDTEYDKYISDQQEMLDNLMSEYTDLMEKLQKNEDELLKQGIKAINDNKVVMKSILDKTADDYGYPTSQNLTSAVTALNNGKITADIVNGESNKDSVTAVIKAKCNEIIAAYNKGSSGGGANGGDNGGDNGGGGSGNNNGGTSNVKTNTAITQNGNVLGGLITYTGNTKTEKSSKTLIEQAVKNLTGMGTSSYWTTKKNPSSKTNKTIKSKNWNGGKILTEKGGYALYNDLITRGLLSGYKKNTLKKGKNTVKSNDMWAALNKAFANAGFRTGGIAKLVKVNGEDGLMMARNGEGFVSPENVQDIRDLMNITPNLTELVSNLTKIPDFKRVIPETTKNVSIDNITFDLPNVKNVSDFTDTIKKPEQQRAFAVAIGDAIAGKKLNINRY